LHVDWIDLDDLTKRSFAESTIQDIWKKHGEAGWRRAEIDALEEALRFKVTILALGGGTPMIPRAVELLNRHREQSGCRIIYLRAKPGTLAARLGETTSDRPSLTGIEPAAEMAAVFAQRDPLYRSLADEVIECDNASVDALVQAAAQSL
jgi:shikimate kinase